VRPSVRTGAREGYVSAIAGLWGNLAGTLTQLEGLAAKPGERFTAVGAAERLGQLQYGLHSASELALGIEPPPGAEAAHAELAEALVDARDVTAEVVDAFERDGAAGPSNLVYEWRVALFRVRLAQLRLAERSNPVAPPPAEPETGPPWAALAATLLVLAGVAAVAGGAMLSLWPLWTVGLALFSAGFLVYRP